jgi:ATP-dependent RNA helicase DHX8/PRP22
VARPSRTVEGQQQQQQQGRGDTAATRPGDTASVRRALAVGFANRLARRMMTHNGYKTYNESATLAQLHPASTHLAADVEGLYPEWVVYHELVSTSRPFLRKVRSAAPSRRCPLCGAIPHSARRPSSDPPFAGPHCASLGAVPSCSHPGGDGARAGVRGGE